MDAQLQSAIIIFLKSKNIRVSKHLLPRFQDPITKKFFGLDTKTGKPILIKLLEDTLLLKKLEKSEEKYQERKQVKQEQKFIKQEKLIKSEKKYQTRKNVNIEEVKSYLNEKFQNQTEIYRITVDNPDRLNMKQIRETFNEALNKIKRKFDGDALLRMYIEFNQLDKPLIMAKKHKGYVKISEFTIDDIFDVIKKLYEIYDAKYINIMKDCLVNFNIQKLPKGSGRTYNHQNLENFVKSKRCIKYINTEKGCAFHSIVCSDYNKNNTNYKLKSIKDNRKPLQKQLAQDLAERVNLNYENPTTLNDMQNISEYIKYQIKIICSENFNKLIYSTIEIYENKEPIYLHKAKNHFHLITNIKAFYSCMNYCTRCDEQWNKSRDKIHVCKNDKDICKNCLNYECKEVYKFETSKLCVDCNRTLKNQKCFNYHLEKTKGQLTTCDRLKKCKKCDIRYNEKGHECNKYFCENCQEFASYENHRCYIKKGKLNSEPMKIMIYDFETMTDKNNVHIVNLAVAIDINNKENKSNIFKGTDDFCEWIFQKEHHNYTFIAHNSKGFDNHFILKYAIENNLLMETIRNGNKLMYTKTHKKNLNIRFIDSFLFMSSSLRKLCETFKVKKGGD